MEKKRYYRAFVKNNIRQMCESMDELNRVIRENRYEVIGDIEICHYYRIDSAYGAGKGHYGKNLKDATSSMAERVRNMMSKVVVEMEDGTFSEISIPDMYAPGLSSFARKTQWEYFLTHN